MILNYTIRRNLTNYKLALSTGLFGILFSYAFSRSCSIQYYSRSPLVFHLSLLPCFVFRCYVYYYYLFPNGLTDRRAGRKRITIQVQYIIYLKSMTILYIRMASGRLACTHDCYRRAPGCQRQRWWKWCGVDEPYIQGYRQQGGFCARGWR